MNWIKGLLNTYGRSLAAKYLTRLVLWGGAAVFTKLGVDSPSADAAAEVGDWGAAVVCALLAALLDRWHHKTDNGVRNAVKTLSDSSWAPQTAEEAAVLQSALVKILFSQKKGRNI